MSGRRNGNQIRGPKSALTDFLAVSSDGENTTEESGTVSDPDQANNISAQQIRDDYERRRAQAVADAAAASGSNSNDQDDVEEQDEEEAEAAIERSRKRRRVQQEAIASIKSKKGKDKKARGKKRKFKKDSDDDDSNDSDYDIDDLERDMNKKKTIKLPGQLENCDVCGKRFTVTPYSKAGPDGGLLCTPCGKQLAAELGESSRAKTKTGSQGRKRRKFESEKLDGRAPMGVKSLSQLCIEKVVQHHGDIDDLGDLPQPLMERLSAIFTKNRVMKPKTLPLFLRPDHDAVIIHDCAYLGHDNFVEMIAKTPLLGKLVLGNACQFKEETMKYLTEKADKLKYLHLYAANLVTNEAFSSFFETRGQYLETLKLKWLDSSFEDSNVADIVSYCPNLVRLKLERCRKLTEESLQFIMQMGCSLQHLSLQFSNPVSNVELMALLEEVGSNLKTLSLRGFVDIDDDVLDTIHNCCNSLSKLRITDNDTCTDEGFAQLFENWSNPPLKYIDLSSNRSIDNNNPGGPPSPLGIASRAFASLMQHSAPSLVHLNVSSCRHIASPSLLAAFSGSATYPDLETIDVSFVTGIDTPVLAGLFRSAPKLKRVVAFGCFGVEDCVVPAGVVVLGLPRAGEGIERVGGSFDLEAALQQMALLQGLEFSGPGGLV